MPVKKILEEELHLSALPKATWKAFLFISKMPMLQTGGWYLAGGTALALQAGHRSSVDLDFFTTKAAFDEVAVERELFASKAWETTYREKGTIYGKLLGAKVSLIAYPFFKPSKNMRGFGTIKILLPQDVASMKIVAISQRGRKRDFVDLYWYCINREPLKIVLDRAIVQYPGQEKNMPHFLKSLTYFTDAEEDAMPNLNFSVTWKEVTSYFKREVPKLARSLGIG